MPKTRVGENEYEFLTMNAEDAVKITLRLSKIFGVGAGKALGALETIPGGSENGLLDKDINIDKLGDAVAILFDRVNEDEAVDTIKKLLSSVMCNGTSMDLNHVNFQGKTLHLMVVVKKSMEVNFADFFDAASGIVGKLQNLLDMIRERHPSSGQSGESSSPK